MNEALLCEMILKDHEKHTLFIEIEILFLKAMYSKWLRVFEITNNRGMQDPSRLQF